MPIDIDAEVIANTRLSDDYNVVALAAPEIASLARPGQFLMVKPSRGIDPLLRRPFSIFEILRDGAGAATGVSLLNKRIGIGTALLYQAVPGSRITCLGPLGRPFDPIDPPAEAWIVAGGVGLGPFVTLAEALKARGTRTRLFYGARRASDLLYVDLFESLGVEPVLATEDGSRGAHGFITVALESELETIPASRALRLYACGPTPMMRAVAQIAQRRGRRCDVSLEQVMGCGLGGCYSCVVLTRTPEGPPHFVRSCVDGPVFDAARIIWDALAH
jgi:dihydroorotate dehydrogenase electron transfer subunit